MIMITSNLNLAGLVAIKLEVVKADCQNFHLLAFHHAGHTRSNALEHWTYYDDNTCLIFIICRRRNRSNVLKTLDS